MIHKSKQHHRRHQSIRICRWECPSKCSLLDHRHPHHHHLKINSHRKTQMVESRRPRNVDRPAYRILSRHQWAFALKSKFHQTQWPISNQHHGPNPKMNSGRMSISRRNQKVLDHKTEVIHHQIHFKSIAKLRYPTLIIFQPTTMIVTVRYHRRQN